MDNELERIIECDPNCAYFRRRAEIVGEKLIVFLGCVLLPNIGQAVWRDPAIQKTLTQGDLQILNEGGELDVDLETGDIECDFPVDRREYHFGGQIDTEWTIGLGI